MSKPEHIPQDLWVVAQSEASGWKGFQNSLAELLANARMDERERLSRQRDRLLGNANSKVSSDVLKAALAACCDDNGNCYNDSYVHVAQRAILAEQERIASAADRLSIVAGEDALGTFAQLIRDGDL